MSPSDPQISIRQAGPEDAELILSFIHALADYEKLRHEAEPASVERLREHLAPTSSACEARIAELHGEPVGFALFFETYSTFETAVCMHLEDLFVLDSARGAGVGKQLLAAVAEAALARGCPRLQWNVLDWNTSAIRFYESLGAKLMPDWEICRVAGADALTRLAQR